MRDRQKIRKTDDLTSFKSKNIQFVHENIDENSNHPGSYLVPLNHYHNTNTFLPEYAIPRPQPPPKEYVNYELNSKWIPVYYSPSDPTEQGYYPLGGYYQPKQINNKLKKPVYAHELPISNLNFYKKSSKV